MLAHMYNDIEAPVYIVCALIFLVIYLRDKIVPHFTRESFLIILTSNLINLFLATFHYKDFSWDLFANEQGAVSELAHMPVVFAQVGAILGLLLFNITKLYIWSLSSTNFLVYIPFYSFCLFFIISKEATPRVARAIIVLGNFLIVGMYASTLFALTLEQDQFHWTTLAFTLYQIMSCLASFFLLLDFLPEGKKKGFLFKLKYQLGFYAGRYIDCKTNYIVLILLAIIYWVTYLLFVRLLNYEPLKWNIYALTITMILNSLIHTYLLKEPLNDVTAGEHLNAKVT